MKKIKNTEDSDNPIYTEYEFYDNLISSEIIRITKNLIVGLKRAKKYSEIKRRRKVIAHKDSTKHK